MDKSEFVLVAKTLTTYYPYVEMTKERTAGYFEALKDLDTNKVISAIKSIVLTSEYMPTVATIRKKVFELSNPQLNNSSSDVLAIVNKSISKFGCYDPIDALEYIGKHDKILEKVVRSIGYRTICESDMQFMGDRITKLYKDEFYKQQEKALATPNMNLVIEDKLHEPRKLPEGFDSWEEYEDKIARLRGLKRD